MVQVLKRIIAFLYQRCCVGLGNCSCELSNYPGHGHMKGLQQEKPQHNLPLSYVVKACMLVAGEQQIHSLASTKVTCLMLWA